jgi:Ni/Fe-hydrogenase subunit HybB-like protein
MSSRAVPIGGALMTKEMRLFAGLFGLGVIAIAWRLLAGLGAVTALNDGYPFGLWIAFDVVTGAALACGGYAVGLLVYILNQGKYHPLMRPAMVTSALGYTLAGVGVGLDVGRWWNLWRVPLFFWHWNFNSALLEVALCITAYIAVLWLRLAPALLEPYTSGPDSRLRRFSVKFSAVVDTLAVPMIVLGLVLATMHQSSLGTLMLLAGSRLHVLWRTPLLPLMFLVSCISMGYAVVVFESAFSSVAFRRKPEIEMLAGLAGAMVPTLWIVVLLRVGDLVWRGQLGALFAGDGRSVMAALEIVLFLVPVVMLASPARRRDLGNLVRAAMAMIVAGALFRFDTFLVAFMPGAHWAYFPSVPEMVVTVGLVAFEILAYVVMVKTFPILAGQAAGGERQAV